ncbi:MAG: putative toxin-antitoxin system toxin component, PIN family [Bacteroidetes bacterium]|nr:putative toxin-antitoxin system toxin component, PIN family [Bacteroidota bacterium]MBI3481895.1 putative toxin-antitoxin system toxin component, PIN family [Bacteroidota bacterium]
MRFVFDCNVLISALLDENSVPAQALKKAKSSSALLISTSVFAELIEVLMRPKFDKYVSPEIRLSFLQEYELLCTSVKIIYKVDVCRDSKDNMYLELALSGKADCIISGDPDLLSLNPFQNIPIITPKEFIMMFAEV